MADSPYGDLSDRDRITVAHQARPLAEDALGELRAFEQAQPDYMSGEEADRFMNVTPEFSETPYPGFVPQFEDQPPTASTPSQIAAQEAPAAPSVGSPEAVRSAMTSGRVFGNASAGPIPPRLGGRVAGRTLVRPGQQAAQAPSQSPPGMEQEPWLPHGEFEATPAQKQLASVYQNGGQISQDVYHRALRDKQAQQEGYARDWRPDMAQVQTIQQDAERMVGNVKNRPEAVQAMTNFLVHHAVTNNIHTLEKEKEAKETRERNKESRTAIDVTVERKHQNEMTKLAAGFINKISILQQQLDDWKSKQEGKTAATAKKTAHVDAAVKHEQDQRKYWRKELSGKANKIVDDAAREKALGAVEDQARGKAEEDAVEYGATTEQGREFQGILRAAPKKGDELDFEKMTPEQLDKVKEAMDQDPAHFGVRRAIGREWSAQLDALAKKRGAALVAQRKKAATTIGTAAGGPLGGALAGTGGDKPATPAATSAPSVPVAPRPLPKPPAPPSIFFPSMDEINDRLRKEDEHKRELERKGMSHYW